MKVGRRAPAGDDVTPVPPRVGGPPPAGRFCDLVLTGGVASGVVYPWAIVELARAFHFRNIGGTSVGAMAAALAAAAEYGRRHGYRNAFEPLRRAPEDLAENLPGGGTRMLSLFQPGNAAGRRLLDLFVAVQSEFKPRSKGDSRERARPVRALLRQAVSSYRSALWTGVLVMVVAVVALAWLVWTNTVMAAGLAFPKDLGQWQGFVLRLGSSSLASLIVVLLTLVGAFVGGAGALAYAVLRDVRVGLIEHNYGLCAGAAQPPDANRPGLVDWLHEGIQRSAGRSLDDPPLTFRDLWRAPMEPASDRRGSDEPGQRAIDLQMLTSSLAHMRPYRLPMLDPSSPLYFKPDELKPYFPTAVLQALTNGARRYERRVPGHPATWRGADLYELPGADLPIAVAARLSLSFPLLFCAIPLYAIDFQQPRRRRGFKRCWFADGGLSSNFPIHLFDRALPRHPTFGMWLDERTRYFKDEAVWLPRRFVDGSGDSWARFDADDAASADVDERMPGPWSRLWRLLKAAGFTAKDWGDRTAMRMPQNRHRVAHLFLRPGEGQLNIAMSRETILRMARTYGRRAGRTFVHRYATRADDWHRQRWVRLRVLVPALQRLLDGFTTATMGGTHVPSAASLITAAQAPNADLLGTGRPQPLSPAQAAAWRSAVAAISTLERTLGGLTLGALPGHAPVPPPELRLRPPL